jgi:Domain of unknown function (DUF4129)
MESSSRARTILLTTLGVAAALTVVAIAARGSIPAGEGGTRRPTQALIDVLFTLYVLALAGGAVLLVYLLVMRRKLEAEGGATFRRRRPLETLLTMIVLIGAGSLLARRLGRPEPRQPEEAAEAVGRPGAIEQTTNPDTEAQMADFAWLPATITVALIALAVGAWWYAGRARKRERGELDRDDLLATELAAALDESLDDLRAEPDPRRAVIASYARLERVLAAHRLPRRPAEAPLEYLARMLDDLSVTPEAARRLTDLFERAKFSQHAVAIEMKEEAIAALETVRDDLLAARALAEQQRREARAAQPGMPAT